MIILRNCHPVNGHVLYFKQMGQCDSVPVAIMTGDINEARRFTDQADAENNTLPCLWNCPQPALEAIPAP